MSDTARSCPRCGAASALAAQFCARCGQSLEPTVTEAATAPLPALDDLQVMLAAETSGVFEIHRELGRGGMGAVYLATEIALGRRVAIKVLPPELAFARDAAERFRREARTAASLDHPHIVPIYRVAERGRLLWYAMKAIEGSDLSTMLGERGAMSEAAALPLLRQVAEALDYAHARGIVHRDFKPHNVMVEPGGRAIVTDFGLAKAREGTKLTATGGLLGTPHYMAPEQWTGGTVSGATDQYAAAVMAFEMWTGQVPFDGDSFGALMHAHLTAPPPLERLPAGAGASVRDALARALSKDAAARYPDVRAFVAALEARPATAAPTVQVPPTAGAGAPPAVEAGQRAPREAPDLRVPELSNQRTGDNQLPPPYAPPSPPPRTPATSGGPPLVPAPPAAETAPEVPGAAGGGRPPAPPPPGPAVQPGSGLDLPTKVFFGAVAALAIGAGILKLMPDPPPPLAPVADSGSLPPPAGFSVYGSAPVSSELLTTQPRLRPSSCRPPVYPPNAQGGGASVTLDFVVDTLGKVESRSQRVVEGTDPDFFTAAAIYVEGCEYRPGRVGTDKVRAQVRQTVTFPARR